MSLFSVIRQTGKKLKRMPVIGGVIRRFTDGNFYLSLMWKHPFDKKFGVDTGGFVPVKNLGADKSLEGKINPYGAAQPSVLRQMLDLIPDIQEYSFIDLGCGKGRADIVASEYPFQRIVGVEISEKLAEVGQKNAATIAKRFPQRTKIEILAGDAVNFPVTSRKMVIYVYNPFGPELMSEMLKNIEKNLQGKIDHLFLVFHNPVSFRLLDSCPSLQRWFVGQFVSDPSERAYGFDIEPVTVIWQGGKNLYPVRCAEVNRAIESTDNFTTRFAA